MLINNAMQKDKKKTLTISSSLKKKIDTSAITSSGKKSFSVEKKKPIRPSKSFNRNNTAPKVDFNKDAKKRILLENLSNNKQQRIL